MIEERSSSVELGRRVREIRVELYGEGEAGLEAISSLMAIPGRTWMNFERGVAVPASLLLQFLLVTRVNPRWLVTGSGARFLEPSLILSGRDVETGSRNAAETSRPGRIHETT